MKKLLFVRLFLSGLAILVLLAGCSQATPLPATATNSGATTAPPTLAATVAPPTAPTNRGTEAPPPTLAPTTTPTNGSTAGVSTVVATVGTAAGDADLQKAVQTTAAVKSFTYSFEQNAELKLKNGNSVSRLQAQGTGEVVRPDIHQAFTWSQNGQRLAVEQIVLNGQAWQKISTSGIWRKLTGIPPVSGGLTTAQLAQASAVTAGGVEKIGSADAVKITFKLPAKLLYDTGLGGSLEGFGLIPASNLWPPFATVDPATQPTLDFTVWVDRQSGWIVQQSAVINLNERNTSLTLKTTYRFSQFNQASVTITRPPDLRQ